MHVHSELPDQRNSFREHEVAMQIVGMGIPDLHVWFNVSWLPTVGEIDILLWHKRIGLFACEVKGVQAHQILELSLRSCRLAYHQKAVQSPQVSLLRKVHDLKNQVRGQIKGPLPFITPVVIWSCVSRQEWKAKFGTPTKELESRLILRDDIFGGKNVFEQALLRVQNNPIIGPSTGAHILDDDRILQSFNQAVSGTGTVVPLKSDVERLLLLEAKVTRQTLPDVPVGQQSRVLYSGSPGTGKTFRLLQLGTAHARSSKSVLFACFNKVLATEAKRLFSMNPSLSGDICDVWVFDVSDLLRLLARSFNIDLGQTPTGDLSEWYPLISEQIRNSSDLVGFDIVLIDEVQDMDEQMLVFLEGLVAEGGSIAAASGIGQNLYGASSTWLERFGSTAKRVRLERNFRNTAPVYRMASEMGRWASVVSTGENVSWEVKDTKFDRTTGRPPSIKMLHDTPRTKQWTAFIHQQIMVEEYKRLIESELIEMHDSEYPNDLLVLVPSDVSNERFYACEALDQLRVRYLDFTKTKANTQPWKPFMDERRRSRTVEAIRLCTYRSSRGIEGTRVLIFGLERALSVATELKADAGALVHIVLSRAVADCTIAVPSSATTVERAAMESELKKISSGSGRT